MPKPAPSANQPSDARPTAAIARTTVGASTAQRISIDGPTHELSGAVSTDQAVVTPAGLEVPSLIRSLLCTGASDLLMFTLAVQRGVRVWSRRCEAWVIS